MNQVLAFTTMMVGYPDFWARVSYIVYIYQLFITTTKTEGKKTCTKQSDEVSTNGRRGKEIHFSPRFFSFTSEVIKMIPQDSEWFI